MGSRQIVLVSTAGFSVLNTGIFWREAKTKRVFSQCIPTYSTERKVSKVLRCLRGEMGGGGLEANKTTDKRAGLFRHNSSMV